MKERFRKYRSHFNDKDFLLSVVFSIVMLVIATYINLSAGAYATEKASNAVTDIILSNIRVYDVDALFIYGPIIFWLFIFSIGIYFPRKIPFTFKTISLFLVIRAFFISLTHIGPWPGQIIVSSQGFFNKFATGNDFFFSAHTGLPFLMALIFWNNKTIRYICLASSVFFACVVLMGHYHYSIDVFGAYFITFTIFTMGKYFFKKDFHRFQITGDMKVI